MNRRGSRRALVRYVFEVAYGGAVTTEQFDDLCHDVAERLGPREYRAITGTYFRRWVWDQIRARDEVTELPRAQKVAGWFVSRELWGVAEYEEAIRRKLASGYRHFRDARALARELYERFGVDRSEWFVERRVS